MVDGAGAGPGSPTDTTIPLWYNIATEPPARQRERYALGMNLQVLALFIMAVVIRTRQRVRAKSSIGIRSYVRYAVCVALGVCGIALFSAALYLTTVSAICSTSPLFFIFAVWLGAWPVPGNNLAHDGPSNRSKYAVKPTVVGSLLALFHSSYSR